MSAPPPGTQHTIPPYICLQGSLSLSLDVTGSLATVVTCKQEEGGGSARVSQPTMVCCSGWRALRSARVFQRLKQHFPNGSTTALPSHMLTTPCDDRSLVVSRMIPEEYTGDKETHTHTHNKPAKSESECHCHPKEDLQGGQKDKMYQIF
jgi:hypothetical protein